MAQLSPYLDLANVRRGEAYVKPRETRGKWDGRAGRISVTVLSSVTYIIEYNDKLSNLTYKKLSEPY